MMNEATIKFIISRVVENARDTIETEKRDQYTEGRMTAFYEVLDIIKSELEAHDQDLKDFGLDIDLEKTFL